MRPSHRSPLYQRLVIAGWRHRTVTLFYLGLALLGIALALAWVGGRPSSALAAAVRPAVVVGRRARRGGDASILCAKSQTSSALIFSVGLCGDFLRTLRALRSILTGLTVTEI